MNVSIKPLLLCCFCIIVISLVMPAYGDIASFKTDKTFYKKGDKITFSGTLSQEDASSVVYVRVMDSAEKKAAFQGTFPDIDHNFKVVIDTSSSKNDFLTTGIYNATAFIVKIENGVSINFDFSLDGSPVPHPETESTQEQMIPVTPQQTQSAPEQESNSDTQTETQQDSTKDDGKSIQEKIRERIEAAKKQRESITMTKNVIHVETNHTSNSTGNTMPIKETPLTQMEQKPDTAVINSPISIDSNVLYVIIGLGAAGAVGTIIYDVKHKTKHQTRYISESMFAEQTPSSGPSIPPEENYALMILKNRLAKGEITIDEFNELKNALKEP